MGNKFGTKRKKPDNLTNITRKQRPKHVPAASDFAVHSQLFITLVHTVSLQEAPPPHFLASKQGDIALAVNFSCYVT